MARIALVPWVVVLLQDQDFFAALLVFLAAGITDGLDGWIAKQFNARTELGALLDPLADKALLVSTYIMLSIMQLIPFWLMVAVVFRDIIIISGYLIMVLFYGSVEMHPLKISKLNTFLQIGFILVVLGSLSWQLELSLMIELLSYAVLLTSVASGSAYAYIWSMIALRSSDELPSNEPATKLAADLRDETDS
ncbi:MAG: CDP-alcohol phosphatidyltransferase family protein [Gammaproteobacteria bacterium]|nr:CDP-alcohol phosphatidyltransferase family protein [Gammaproteobacteria bacterium]